LEEYPTPGARREAVHGRNRRTLATMYLAYRSYLDDYIGRVEQAPSEDALRAVGPPQSPFQMPVPSSANRQERVDLWDAFRASEYRAWVAVAHQLDRIQGRRIAGYPFLRIKPTLVMNGEVLSRLPRMLRPDYPAASIPRGAKVEFEMAFDFQFVDGRPHAVVGDPSLAFKGELDFERNRQLQRVRGRGAPVPTKVALKGTPEGEWGLEAEFGLPRGWGVGIELESQGEQTLKLKTPWTGDNTVDVFTDPSHGVIGAGMTISLRPIADRLRRRFGDRRSSLDAEGQSYIDALVGVLEDSEIQVAIGFQGLTEEAVLAVVSNAPGFFERRSTPALFAPELRWNDLTLREQIQLEKLGWNQPRWDFKYDVEVAADDPVYGPPASLRATRQTLSAEEKVAIIHLGFRDYDDYARQYRQVRRQFETQIPVLIL
jgi:hypothetical protein